jgi:lipoic acid synthetase
MVLMGEAVGGRVRGMERLPRHLKKRLPMGAGTANTRGLLQDLKLHTICDEARCPNRVECYAHGVATFLLMGDVCTRACRFCSVTSGRPAAGLDASEPQRVGEAVRRMGLRHVVITSVDRDDLADGGARHFAETIAAIRLASPGTAVEVLTPDFQGDTDAVDIVMGAAPEVFGHNVETVLRLQRTVRPGSSLERSLAVLRHASRPGSWTKTGLMVGLGETEDEVTETLREIREAGVDIVTIGQYLQPTRRQMAVREFIEPGQFVRHEAAARALGFSEVLAGPFVRSSYLADQIVPKTLPGLTGAGT